MLLYRLQVDLLSLLETDDVRSVMEGRQCTPPSFPVVHSLSQHTHTKAHFPSKKHSRILHLKREVTVVFIAGLGGARQPTQGMSFKWGTGGVGGHVGGCCVWTWPDGRWLWGRLACSSISRCENGAVKRSNEYMAQKRGEMERTCS